MSLTAQQIEELRIHVQAGDRIAYYTTLSNFGYVYGSLALGVVENSTLNGAAANEYFLDVAAEEGLSINSNQLADISLRLMLEDFARREASGGDLTVDEIQDYHEAIFDLFGVSSLSSSAKCNGVKRSAV